MRENRDFVVPVNILTPFAHAPFSWAARHTTVCLDFKLHVCPCSIGNRVCMFKLFKAFFAQYSMPYSATPALIGDSHRI